MTVVPKMGNIGLVRSWGTKRKRYTNCKGIRMLRNLLREMTA